MFAADSKITTSGIIGYEENGDPRWVEQTYDNANKVVHDKSKTVMTMVAGEANIGLESATDLIMAWDLSSVSSNKDQDKALSEFVTSMVNRKRAYWEKTEVPSEDWPGPTLLVAAPSSKGSVPRVWRILLNGADSETQEILAFPHIWLEGSYNETFGLLYGYELTVLQGITDQLGIDKEKLNTTMENLKVLRPVDKLSLWSMPIQDAVELAVFLAKVQVEMDRFLPGTPACGGPIDVMVLRMVPNRDIISFPGKTLHHP